MSVERSHFTPEQLQLVDEVAHLAEELIGDRFRLSSFGPRRYAYEVATQRDLSADERDSGAFAQLCCYGRDGREPFPDGARGALLRFYRVCLQDENILAGWTRAAGRFDLRNLLLYIMAHELIHVVRFERFQQALQADPVVRDEEEALVHKLTAEVLLGSGQDRRSVQAIASCYQRP